MPSQERTLLIVEDQDDISAQLAVACQHVLQALSSKLPTRPTGVVKQAKNYQQAKTILKEQPIDFISIDIALSKQEEGLQANDLARKAPGGMALLRELQEIERPPIAVMVSGETQPDYFIKSLGKYGALAFYRKPISFNEYMSAVRAALWYWDAVELVSQDIKVAQDCWKQALKAAKAANLDTSHFPTQVGQKIKSLTHPITQLPDVDWTENKLRKKAILDRDEWVFTRVIIKGFEDFVEKYKSQEKGIFNRIASLLKKARDEFQDQEISIGHLGHHASEFVIISGTKRIVPSEIQRWIKTIETRFNDQAHLFAPSENLASQKKLKLTFEAKILTSDEEAYSDLHSLLDALGSP